MGPHTGWHQEAALRQRLPKQNKTPSTGPMVEEPLWTRPFLRIWFLNLAVFSAYNMLLSTFPFYLKHLGGTEMVIGIVAGGVSLFSLLVRPLAGWMLDNVSRRLMLFVGILGMLATSLVYLLVPVLGFVVAARLLNGFMFASSSTSNATISCDIVPASRFSEGIGMFGLTNSLAMAVAPALGLALLKRWNYTVLFAVTVAICALAFWLAFHLEFRPVGRAAGQPRQKFNLRSLLCREAFPAAVVTLLASVTYGAISSFVALFGEEYQLGSGGMFFTLMAVGTGTMRLISGRTADRKGEGPLVYWGMAGLAVGMVLLAWRATPAYYASGLFCGIGNGLFIPALQAMAMRSVPMARRGSASSTFLCAFDISMAVGAVLAGGLVTWAGYRPMFAVMSVFALASVLVYHFWAAKTPSAWRMMQQAGGKERE